MPSASLSASRNRGSNSSTPASRYSLARLMAETVFSAARYAARLNPFGPRVQAMGDPRAAMMMQTPRARRWICRCSSSVMSDREKHIFKRYFRKPVWSNALRPLCHKNVLTIGLNAEYLGGS